MIDLTDKERRRLRELAANLLDAQGEERTTVPTPAWDDFVAATRPGVILSMLAQIERQETELARQGGPERGAELELQDFTIEGTNRGLRVRVADATDEALTFHSSPALALALGAGLMAEVESGRESAARLLDPDNGSR